MIRSIYLLCMTLLVFSCESNIKTENENLLSYFKTNAKNTGNIILKSLTTRLSPNYDIGSNIILSENNDIWATGGWNSRRNVLYRASIGDFNWETIELPVESLSVTASLSFSDSKNGVAIGGLRIVKTDDGGTSWKEIKLPGESRITNLQSVQFANSQIGYVGGTTGYISKENYKSVQGFEILCTEDSGNTWNVCYRNNKNSSIYHIVTLSEQIAVGLVDGILLFITEDKGKNWKEIELPIAVTSIAKNNDGSIWLIGDGGIQVSKDKGKSWNTVSDAFRDDANYNWKSIDFNLQGVGVVVGDNGSLAITKDNGESWEIKNSIMSENLLKVKINNTFFIVFGEKNLYSLTLNNVSSR